MAQTYSIEIDGVKKSGLTYTEYIKLKQKLKAAQRREIVSYQEQLQKSLIKK